jgi:hypothetical protein
MKVWELIAELMEQPAGNDVNVALFSSVEALEKRDKWLATASSIRVDEDCSGITVIYINSNEHREALEN